MKKLFILLAVVLATALMGGIVLRNNTEISNIFDEYYFVRISPVDQKLFSVYVSDLEKFSGGIKLVNYGDSEIGMNYIAIEYREEILEDNMKLFVELDPDDKNFAIYGWVYFDEEKSEALNISITYDVRKNIIVYKPISIISKRFRDDGDSVGAHSVENINAFMKKYSINNEFIHRYYQYFLDIIVEHWTSGGSSQFSMDNWGKYTVKDRALVYLTE